RSPLQLPAGIKPLQKNWLMGENRRRSKRFESQEGLHPWNQCRSCRWRNLSRVIVNAVACHQRDQRVAPCSSQGRVLPGWSAASLRVGSGNAPPPKPLVRRATAQPSLLRKRRYGKFGAKPCEKCCRNGEWEIRSGSVGKGRGAGGREGRLC